MQIVIDIDDNLYTRLFDNGDEYVMDMRRACVAIRKGTPLDKIRADIDVARFIDKDTKVCKNANESGLEVAMQILDKYKAKREG